MSHCFQAVARAWLLSGVLLLLAISRLSAAPDPDLFDGRVALPPPQPSGSDHSEEEAIGSTEPSADNGSESSSSELRDLSQIDGVTVGQPVGAESSKASDSKEPDTTTEQSSTDGDRDYDSVGQVGGGESVESGSSKASASAGGGGGAIPPGAVPGSATSAGGSGTAGVSAERSFEDFGFGSINGSNSTVPVNRSKESPESSSAASSATMPTDSSTPNSSSGAGASTSAKSGGGGSGDYGSNLPSGL